MKLPAAINLIFLLSGCMAPTTAPPLPHLEELGSNTCLPEAVIAAESLHKRNIPAKVILISTASFTHAVTVYRYPASKPSLWVWDNTYDLVEVEADFESAVSIAVHWIEKIGRSDVVISATFL